MKRIMNSLLVIAMLVSGVYVVASTNNFVIENQPTQKIIKVDGANNTRSIKAMEGDIIVIEGVNNKINVVGDFSELKVEGANNVVRAEGVKKIYVEGTNNVFNLAKVDVVNIEGAGNKVNYKSTTSKTGIPIGKTEGVNNVITKVK